MNKFTLKFKDAQLESLFQNDKKYIKSLNFYKFLILEFVLDIAILLINSFTYETEIIETIFCCVFLIIFIILVILLVFKCNKCKYTLDILVFIHLLSMCSLIFAVWKRYSGTSEYFLMMTIYCSAMQLGFISILITRIQWFWSSFFDLLYHIFFIFIIFSIDQIKARPVIFLAHFICFFSYLMISYDQEKSMRELYKIISDSNERLNEFRMLMKNIIPFPTLILDPEKKVEFVNNSALALMRNNGNCFKEEKNQNNNLNLYNNNTERTNFLVNTSENEELTILSEFEKFLLKCELISQCDSTILPEEKIFAQLITLSKNTSLFKLSEENLEFSQMAIRLKDKPSLELISVPENELAHDYHINRSLNQKYFILKVVKILFNQKPNLLIIVNDVTDLNKLKELENLDNYKNQLLATVSHDLRTPLNGMIGMMEAVLPNIKEKKDKKHLNIAIRSGYLLGHMINDILDFSQINSKKLRLIKQSVDLVQLVKETLKIIKFQIKAKGLKLIFNTELEIAEILSDSCRIKQILLNLITNALKFTKKGFIKVSIERSHVFYQEASYYTLMVEDSGIGIKDEDIPRLFKLFGKLDHEDSKLNKTGIGLGLTISANLAKMLNPHDPKGVYLESTLGKGSKFWLFLKDELNLEEKVHKIIENSSKNENEIKDLINEKNQIINDFVLPNENILRNKKVLIVDDDLVNVMVAEMYCKHYQMISKAVNDGIQAVDFVKNEVISNQNLIDFIIMDCNMPIMNGYQATLEIIKMLKTHQKKNIPVIGLTANVLQEDLERCLSVGMTCFLTKPVKREDFGETLKKISRQEIKIEI